MEQTSKVIFIEDICREMRNPQNGKSTGIDITAEMPMKVTFSDCLKYDTYGIHEVVSY